jgi:hypothetical protein
MLSVFCNPFRAGILFLLTLSLGYSSEIPFGHPGGPAIQGVDKVISMLREDPYQLEILMSFGTSTGGAAGHLALSIRDPQTNEETVHSANFYADRTEEHSGGHYVDDVVMAIPKKEYIFGVKSSISKDASFGLDYGEIFKRSLVGVRLNGLTIEEVRSIQAFYQQVNQDYRERRDDTDYFRGEVVYDYMNFNCAKSVALALKHGGGISEVKVKGNHILGNTPYLKMIFAHTPTSTTMNILKVAQERNWDVSAVLYKRFEGSTYLDHESETEFKDLPNRFPSFKSLDYFQGSKNFEDWDNLYAMNLLYELGKFSFVISAAQQRVLLEKQKNPTSLSEAVEIARQAASKKSKNVLRRLVRGFGIRFTPTNDNSDLYTHSSFIAEDDQEQDLETLSNEEILLRIPKVAP